ncbi:MAG TPA: hypothetical protein VJ343_03070 [archaeon]|nr:hypothetical protein [archaeon]
MLYRKLYLYALLSFALGLIPFVNVVAWIAFAIAANYIYYKHSKNKLIEIKQAQQSPKMQRDVAVRTGGVNSWVVTVVPGVAVIGILAAIMIPGYLGMQARARNSQAKAEVQRACEVAKNIFLKTPQTDVSLYDLQVEGFTPSPDVELIIRSGTREKLWISAEHKKGSIIYETDNDCNVRLPGSPGSLVPKYDLPEELRPKQ